MTMKLSEKVSGTELRKFGIGLAVILPLLFYAILPWLFGLPRVSWPLLAGAGVLLVALLFPLGLWPVYRALMWIAVPLGRINSVLLLSLVYFLMVVPMGLVMRMLGKDPIPKRFDASASTYRRESSEPTSLEVPF
ncbi:MAG TPA: hypothetical protein DHU56_13335 [Marinobacter sp.]|jgi:hypothetical protein|nr:hypothetical protein [Marinobacter sp.]